MKVLVVGSNGPLGWEQQRTCPDHVDLSAKGHPDIDITDEKGLTWVLWRHQLRQMIREIAH